MHYNIIYTVGNLKYYDRVFLMPSMFILMAIAAWNCAQ